MGAVDSPPFFFTPTDISAFAAAAGRRNGSAPPAPFALWSRRRWRRRPWLRWRRIALAAQEHRGGENPIAFRALPTAASALLAAMVDGRRQRNPAPRGRPGAHRHGKWTQNPTLRPFPGHRTARGCQKRRRYVGEAASFASCTFGHDGGRKAPGTTREKRDVPERTTRNLQNRTLIRLQQAAGQVIPPGCPRKTGLF